MKDQRLTTLNPCDRCNRGITSHDIKVCQELRYQFNLCDQCRENIRDGIDHGIISPNCKFTMKDMHESIRTS